DGSAGTDRLVPTGTLVTPWYLHSASATYQAVMQSDGNFVIYQGTRPLWSSRSSGHPGSRLTFQTDGNVVIRSAQGAATWSSGTQGRHPSTLTIQSDGNLVIRSGATA